MMRKPKTLEEKWGLLLEDGFFTRREVDMLLSSAPNTEETLNKALSTVLKYRDFDEFWDELFEFENDTTVYEDDEDYIARNSHDIQWVSADIIYDETGVRIK